MPGSDNTEEIKTEEEIWDKFNKSDETVHFSFPEDRILVEATYKVNVYAIAESEGHSSESKELHEEFVIKSSTGLRRISELYFPNDSMTHKNVLWTI